MEASNEVFWMKGLDEATNSWSEVIRPSWSGRGLEPFPSDPGY